jgi:hypothetical protein
MTIATKLPEIEHQTQSISSACRSTREQFSGYLDGVVSGKVMQQIARHLEGCPACTADFEQWRASLAIVSSIGPAKAPEDLALRLRVALSQAAAQTPRAKVDRWKIQWADVYRPFALRATAGFASAVFLIGTVAMLASMFAAPQPVEARDEPLSLVSGPRFLYSSLEPDTPIGNPDSPVIVEAYVNNHGKVYDYRIVSGDPSPAMKAQLENTLLFSLFEPARSFGAPVRGTVVMSFSGVSVKG